MLLKLLLLKKKLSADIYGKAQVIKIMSFVYLFLEMQSMEHDSGQLKELQKQKSELMQELFTLQRNLKGHTSMCSFI